MVNRGLLVRSLDSTTLSLAHGRTLLDLAARLKSGALPEWKINQEEAYKNAPLGQLRTKMKPKEQTHNDS